MSVTAPVPAISSGLHGRLLTPDCSGYDPARSVWNAMIDDRPATSADCGRYATTLVTASKAGVLLYTGPSTVPFGDRLAAVPISGLWAEVP